MTFLKTRSLHALEQNLHAIDNLTLSPNFLYLKLQDRMQFTKGRDYLSYKKNPEAFLPPLSQQSVMKNCDQTSHHCTPEANRSSTIEKEFFINKIPYLFCVADKSGQSSRIDSFFSTEFFLSRDKISPVDFIVAVASKYLPNFLIAASYEKNPHT